MPFIEFRFNDIWTSYFQSRTCNAKLLSSPADFVVMVGLESFNDLWGYAVEPLMPIRSKVKFQTKRNTGICAVRVEVRFQVASVHQIWLCKRTRDGVTPKENHLSKRLSWSQQTRRGPLPGPPSTRATGTVQTIPWTWHQGLLKERAGFLVSRSLTLSTPQKKKILEHDLLNMSFLNNVIPWTFTYFEISSFKEEFYRFSFSRFLT